MSQPEHVRLREKIGDDLSKGAASSAMGCRPRIGLALSSGGAKGLAHIGVIQILEENGIPIDAVAGTSMGAYVGSLYAAGFSGRELENLAAEITNKRNMLDFIDPVVPPRRGFIRGNRIRKRLEKSLGDRSFADLKIPFFAVATETESFSAKVLTGGNVAEAVHASIAIPGVFEPVRIGETEYVDGAISDPIPVTPLRQADVDIVLAVCVIPNAIELAKCKAEKQAESRDNTKVSASGKAKRKRVSRYFNYFAPGNILDTLRRSVMGVQTRLAEVMAEQADLVIRPVLCDASFQDYTNYPALIEKGRQTTTEMIPEIQALIETHKRRIEIHTLPTHET